VKWPNDVLYKGQKLAGILIEMRGDPAGYCEVIIGIGINVAMGGGQAEVIDQPWIDLRSILVQQGLPSISRNVLVATLIDELALVLQDYEQTGFIRYRTEWESFNAHSGRQIELHNGNVVHRGVCVGVSEVGALMLETSQGCEEFHGGEISLRQANDS
jgi:BirA family biotin operon repressor/biotin-[acetyl-CoA-carboxylase] ligase